MKIFDNSLTIYCYGYILRLEIKNGGRYEKDRFYEVYDC